MRASILSNKIYPDTASHAWVLPVWPGNFVGGGTLCVGLSEDKPWRLEAKENNQNALKKNIFQAIKDKSVYLSFIPNSLDVRNKEIEISSQRDPYIFSYLEKLPFKKFTNESFESALEFLCLCIRARQLNAISITGNEMEEAFLKYPDFFFWDNGKILEFNAPVSSDSDDTASSARTSPELSEKQSMSESSSNETLDGFNEASSLVVPAFPAKEKEELEAAVSQKQKQELKPQALQEAQKKIIDPNSSPKPSYTPALFQAESKSDDVRKIKKLIISAIESFTLDLEDELIIYGLDEALRKTRQKFEALSEEGKKTTQGIKLAEWISVLEKKKKLVPPEGADLKFRDPKRGFRPGEVDKGVIRDLREKTAGALNGINGAKTISEVRGVLSLLHGNLCEANQHKNKRRLNYSESPVLTLVENFLVSDCKEFSPLEKRVWIAEKRKAREVSRAARPNDLPIIFAVLAAVLQFLSELVAAFCDSKTSPVPACFLSA